MELDRQRLTSLAATVMQLQGPLDESFEETVRFLEQLRERVSG